MATIDPSEDLRSYRNALGSFATGVTIVTTQTDAGKPVGLTVNSFTSVSLEPPLVLWSLARKSPSLGIFDACRHYGINVLASHQAEHCARFATPMPDKFAGTAWSASEEGVPLLEGVAMQLVCENQQRIEAGDHVIFLGRVLHYAPGTGQPLIFCRGEFIGNEPAPEGTMRC
jgi:3-hydroxy-9,10-secoandrosta-1,3,5(10)-triene-9,17-dione monooxygenase reductase component